MRLHRNIASFGGVGYFPLAPGTAGAFVGAILFYLFYWILYYFQLNNIIIYASLIFMTIVLTLLANISINKLNEEWKHDASQIVIDEVVGVWVALLLIPFQWEYFLMGFVLFRFFDIVKPLGIKKVDKLSTNWSVILDDIIAGIYANLCLQLIIFII